MQILFYGEQHLIGVHGLYQIVGYLGAHRTVHDVLLLALGNHHHGCVGTYLLYLGEGFETGHARHHLVEYDEIVTRIGYYIYSVVTVVATLNVITLALQKQQMRFEQLYLVVDPQYVSVHRLALFYV